MNKAFGRTIQLFLVDGNPTGLIMASIHGWTGSIFVSTQSTFGELLQRSETDRTGIYILYGPDPSESFKSRVYIGEADSVRERIANSAGSRSFWEIAVVITVSDETLTKGHVRYLEARLIDMARNAGRVSLDNSQIPEAERRRLPEADKANMEAFLENIKMILPVVGLDMLKPVPQMAASKGINSDSTKNANSITGKFEIRHKSGVKAYAFEENGEFIIQEGSEALKDPGYTTNSYKHLREELIEEGVLVLSDDAQKYIFSRPFAFRSPSAAGAVVLDRNTNGRTKWHLIGTDLNYHEWQSGQKIPDPSDE